MARRESVFTLKSKAPQGAPTCSEGASLFISRGGAPLDPQWTQLTKRTSVGPNEGWSAMYFEPTCTRPVRVPLPEQGTTSPSTFMLKTINISLGFMLSSAGGTPCVQCASTLVSILSSSASGPMAQRTSEITICHEVPVNTISPIRRYEQHAQDRCAILCDEPDSRKEDRTNLSPCIASGLHSSTTA